MAIDMGRIEQKLADIEGLARALIFVGEHAEDGELAFARDCAVSLLYIMTDAIREAERETAVFAARMASLAPAADAVQDRQQP